MNGERTESEHRLTVPEAAEVLGISSEAVRTRIQRSTLASVREGGRVYVVMGPDRTPPPDDQTYAWDELVAALRSEIAHLREEARRRDAILLRMAESIPALEAPREPESASDEGPGPSTPPEPQTGTERVPWWRRMFGG
jgi:hypothetical protein